MAHLAVDPQAPLLVRAAAEALLWGHIGGGTVGIGSGFVALFAAKGGWWHRKAGTAFFAAMLVMSGVGAVVAPFLDDPVSSIAGLLTFYLVLTGWRTVRSAGAVSLLDKAGLALVLAIGAVDAGLFLVAQGLPHHTFAGVPPQAFVVIGVIVALAAAMDLRVILRGGLQGPQRLARHLWRMCAALAIASGSAFLGQPKVQTVVPLHGFWLFAPELVVLGLMATWLVRVRRRKQAKQGGLAHA